MKKLCIFLYLGHRVGGEGSNVIVRTHKIPTLLWKQTLCVWERWERERDGGENMERVKERERKQEMKKLLYKSRADFKAFADIQSKNINIHPQYKAELQA